MPPPEVTVDLNPASYQSSLSAFRALLDSAHGTRPFLFAGVRTPAGDTVVLQVRTANCYIVAFEGADGWYCFDDEPGALGKPAGTGSNYNQLGVVGNIAYDDLRSLGNLARFRKGEKLDKRLVAIVIALTSEAARFRHRLDVFHRTYQQRRNRACALAAGRCQFRISEKPLLQ